MVSINASWRMGTPEKSFYAHSKSFKNIVVDFSVDRTCDFTGEGSIVLILIIISFYVYIITLILLLICIVLFDYQILWYHPVCK